MVCVSWKELAVKGEVNREMAGAAAALVRSCRGLLHRAQPIYRVKQLLDNRAVLKFCVRTEPGVEPCKLLCINAFMIPSSSRVVYTQFPSEKTCLTL